MVDSLLEPYAVVQMGLRAPRIAIVFDGDHSDWSFLVRRAAYLSCQRWGGAGFAFVPHRSGEVSAVMLRACAAYDPDYVVTMPWRVGDLSRPDVDATAAADSDDRIMIESPDDQIVGSTAEDRKAREQVVSICSSYRRRLDLPDLSSLEDVEDMAWDEVNIDLSEQSPPEVMTLPAAPTPVSLACPPAWGGLLGVAAASWAGVIERPVRGSAEPILDDMGLASCATWWLGGSRANLPRELIHFPNGVHTGVLTEQLSTVYQRTMTGLSSITHGNDRRVPWLVVLGDEPEDFALARLWAQLHGNAYWLPSPLLDAGKRARGLARRELSNRLHEARQQGAPLILTSTSRTADELTGDAASLFIVPPSRPGKDVLAPVATTADDLDWKQRQRLHFGITDQYDTPHAVPVTTSETGTRTMAAPLPAPLPRDPALASVSLPIQVDITWEDPRSVTEHGLVGDHLRSPATDPHLTWIRASRVGTSFEAARFDMVVPGMQAESRTARPRLRDLGLRDWVAAICDDNDLTIRTSPAGHHGAQLTRMLGSRTAFVDLFSGPLLTAMQAMRPTEKSTPAAYPDKDGVRIDQGIGVLTFGGIHTRTQGITSEQTRDLLDTALKSAVLRRGLALLCGICEQGQFVPVDRLGQRWTCHRCDAVNELDRTAWKMPNDEPTWFYDLHPVAHNLLANNGEVPALLSARLRGYTRNNSRLHDIDEIEIFRNGKAVVELDLVACVDNKIIVAECKSPGNLGVNGKRAGLREIYKKCQAAKDLHADVIIFATAAPQWETTIRDWIREATEKFDFGPLGAPIVELIEGLKP